MAGTNPGTYPQNLISLCFSFFFISPLFRAIWHNSYNLFKRHTYHRTNGVTMLQEQKGWNENIVEVQVHLVLGPSLLPRLSTNCYGFRAYIIRHEKMTSNLIQCFSLHHFQGRWLRPLPKCAYRWRRLFEF